MAAAIWHDSSDDDNDSAQTQRDACGEAPCPTHGERRPVAFTRHACKRGARRNVAPDAVDYVLTHGRLLQRTGVTFCFLGWRDMPPADRCASWAARLEGTILLLAPDGTVITVYRNRRALPAIRRKMKYRLPDLNLAPDAADEEPAMERATA